jgi:membrane protein implicated in regulation of membrane protease activity
MYAVLRKDALLFVYLLVLFVLPLSLYLLINPMFVFERYFIFLLPFALLVLGRGIVTLAGRLRPPFRSSLVIALVAMLVYLQYPAITRMLNQDRQNYREAVRYVEEEMDSRAGDQVCSLGYAGEHFRYYTRKVSVYNPESMDELSALMKGKERIWCLITAWLPDLRPSCEDEALYAERPGQVELYNYVKTHFVLKKHFSSKYGVDIYYKEQ